VLSEMALARSSGKSEMPSGSDQAEVRAPGTPDFCCSSVCSLLVAHSMNFQAFSVFSEASLMPSAHDGTLYGLEPAGPAGNGAKPTWSETLDLSGSVAFL